MASDFERFDNAQVGVYGGLGGTGGEDQAVTYVDPVVIVVNLK